MGDWAASLMTGGSLAGIASMLVAGLVTALNPCMLAMAPAAAGYVGGTAGSGRQGLTLSVMCVLGYAGMLALLGLPAGLIGRALVPAGAWSRVLGVVYVALGGYLLLGRHRLKLVPWRVAGFYYSPSVYRMEQTMGRGTVLGALALGAVFSLTPSPCATPVVLAVMGTAAATGGVLKGMMLLFTFGVGHSSVLLISSALTGVLKGNPRWARWTRWTNPVLGVALLILGLYLLSGERFLTAPAGEHVH